MKRAVVVFSGGQDSTTCLIQALQQYDEVHCITFDYGQRHRAEIDVARALATQLGAKAHKVLDVGMLNELAVSSLTRDSIPIPSFDEILEAGDVLYVPPKLSHFGVAQDDCLTFSFGCRRPNLMQIIDSLADIATNDSDLFIPMLLPQALQASGELQASSINAIKDQLLQMLQSERGSDIIRQAVSEVVSKRQYDALMPEDTLDTDELMQALAEGATLQADYSNRLLYSQTNDGIMLYANGQRIDGLDETAVAVLVRLANGEHLNSQDVTDVDADDLSEWLENGWVWIDIAE